MSVDCHLPSQCIEASEYPNNLCVNRPSGFSDRALFLACWLRQYWHWSGRCTVRQVKLGLKGPFVLLTSVSLVVPLVASVVAPLVSVSHKGRLPNWAHRLQSDQRPTLCGPYANCHILRSTCLPILMWWSPWLAYKPSIFVLSLLFFPRWKPGELLVSFALSIAGSCCFYWVMNYVNCLQNDHHSVLPAIYSAVVSSHLILYGQDLILSCSTKWHAGLVSLSNPDEAH